jgi:hypothetical protein
VDALIYAVLVLTSWAVGYPLTALAHHKMIGSGHQFHLHPWVECTYKEEAGR